LREAIPDEGVPIGAAVWTGLSMLISAFVGGYLSARLSGSTERPDGLYHGVVVWGVNWLVFAWLTTTTMATLIGGAFSLFGTTLQTLGQGLASTAPPGVSRIAGHLTLSAEDLRREVESVLRATEKSELQPEGMQRDAGRAVPSAKQGEPLSHVNDEALAELRGKLSSLDRDAAINIMVNTLGMSGSQARDVVQSTIGLLEPIHDTVRGAIQRSIAVRAEALDRLGMLALWLSGLALISLVISAIGGMIGTPDESLVESTALPESYRDLRRAS
jgi:hypothetical protein